MSAFVIEPNTMHRSVCAIIERAQYGHVIEMFAGRLVYLPDSPTAIGRALYSLNIMAVRGRYPHFGDTLPGVEGANTMADTYRFCIPLGCGLAVNSLTNRVGNLKSLRCLRYQCSEDPAMGHPLWTELDRAIGIIAESIVCQMPQYEKAVWGH